MVGIGGLVEVTVGGERVGKVVRGKVVLRVRLKDGRGGIRGLLPRHLESLLLLVGGLVLVLGRRGSGREAIEGNRGAKGIGKCALDGVRDSLPT